MSKEKREKKPKGALWWIWRVLSGFELAVISMFLLLILTWLCTLEQVEVGIYWTLEKYFSFEAFTVRPTLNGKDLPIILPGGYWVCGLFTLNLFLGGLIRARKGWKQTFLLISHFSMVFLMVAGAVGYHQSKEALMVLKIGERADYAKNTYEESIEVFEVIDGKKTEPTVINAQRLSGLRGDSLARREFMLPNFPFDMEVTGYLTSAVPVKAPAGSAKKGVIEGMILQQVKPQLQEELNMSACYAKLKIKKGGESKYLLLSEASPNYSTVTVDGRIYGVQLVQEIWPMPYTIELLDSRGEYYPNTSRPKSYESDIRVHEKSGDEGKDFHVEMNEPLRYSGLTTYQTLWEKKDGVTTSGFTLKSNPSDQWPKIAIYVCGAALGCHFLLKLSLFIASSVGGGKRAK